jgi:hypothetical protein
MFPKKLNFSLLHLDIIILVGTCLHNYLWNNVRVAAQQTQPTGLNMLEIKAYLVIHS